MSRDTVTSHANSRRALLLASASTAAMAALPNLAWAQGKYPSRPVEFIVPWGAGGGADQVSRRIGKLLEDDLGASIPVLNVPGATGNTGTSKLLNAAPDGYTMALLIGDTLATLAGGHGRWKLADVVPLGVIIRQPSGLFVKYDAKWKTFDELLADAKVNEIKGGITGFGSADELHLLQMKQKGLKFRPVPFAKAGVRYTSILGGHADVLVEQAGDIRSFLESKQMRPLVFFSDKPAVGFPDVPLAKDHGFPLRISQFRAILMRAGTDPKQVATMAAAIEKAASTEDFKSYLKNQYAFADSFIPAAQTSAFFEHELTSIDAALAKKS
jgi:tripartite-type tricarboxylate transporter receptor subunit TctC